MGVEVCYMLFLHILKWPYEIFLAFTLSVYIDWFPNGKPILHSMQTSLDHDALWYWYIAEFNLLPLFKDFYDLCMRNIFVSFLMFFSGFAIRETDSWNKLESISSSTLLWGSLYRIGFMGTKQIVVLLYLLNIFMFSMMSQFSYTYCFSTLLLSMLCLNIGESCFFIQSDNCVLINVYSIHIHVILIWLSLRPPFCYFPLFMSFVLLFSIIFLHLLDESNIYCCFIYLFLLLPMFSGWSCGYNMHY